MPQDGSFLFATMAKVNLCVVSAAASFAVPAASDGVLLFWPQAVIMHAISAGIAKNKIVFFMLIVLKSRRNIQSTLRLYCNFYSE